MPKKENNAEKGVYGKKPMSHGCVKNDSNGATLHMKNKSGYINEVTVTNKKFTMKGGA